MMIRWAETCHCGQSVIKLHELPDHWMQAIEDAGVSLSEIPWSVRVEVNGVRPDDARYDPARHTLHYPQCGLNPKVPPIRDRKTKGF